MTRVFHVFLVVGLTALTDSDAFAASPAEVLSENSRMLFCDTPLEQVTDFLSDQHEIRFMLAPSVDGSESVTFDADGPLEVLLSHLLKPMHLECRVDGDSLVFTPTGRAAYAKGRRQRAQQQRAERDLEQRTRRSLEAVGGCLVTNDYGWVVFVELRGAKVRDSDVASLRCFRRLQRLDLSGAGITDTAIEELKGLTHLAMLAVGGTSITDAGLAHLKTMRYLETLDIADTRITNDGLQKLTEVPSLHTVYAEGTRVTTDGIVKVHKSGTRVRVFEDRPVRPSQAKDDRR